MNFLRPSSTLGILLLTWLLTAPAQAATVRATSPAKNMVALDVEDGESPAKGDTYCIVGPKKKPLDCGKVVKIKGKVAIIALASGAKIGKIKKGMAAKNSGGGSSDGGESAPDDGGDSAAAPNAKSKLKNDARSSGSPKGTPFRLWLLADPAPASPFTYKQITYKAPDGTATPSTLWAPGKAPSTALFSFGGQIGIPIGKSAVNLGARMRTFSPPSSVDTDYTVGVQNPYANTAVTAKSFGGWLDYQLIHKAMTPSLFFNFLPGLDLDYSTVSVTATKKNDNAPDSGSIVTATSKLMVVSLRLGANMDIFFGKSFGLTIGGTALLPLAPLSPATSASFPTGEDRGLADPVTDLKTALGHKKNSLGLEALAAVFVAL